MLELLYFQKGFNYSQDGPGNRLVYHLQGCNMKCAWCSNPEGISIEHKCNKSSVDEIIEEINSCQSMFFDGGGVTFTGGEATLQLDAVAEIMKRVKANGISTALETNGTNKNLVSVLPYCDYLIIDLKHPNLDVHKRYTGISNEVIKKNIAKASKKQTVHIRIPLIHSFNDDKKTIEEFICFFTLLLKNGCKFDVELLPYHEYGKEKWLKLGMDYTVENGFVSKELIAYFINILITNEIKVIMT